MKKCEKVFGFLDNCIELEGEKISLSSSEYMSTAIKVLANGPKISGLTKRDVFLLNLSENYVLI